MRRTAAGISVPDVVKKYSQSGFYIRVARTLCGTESFNAGLSLRIFRASPQLPRIFHFPRIESI